MTNLIESSPFLEMNAYEKMPSGVFPPYVMLANPACFSSYSINTDKYGFRKSLYQGELHDIDFFRNAESVSLVVGASTAFGVGASRDSSTIASLLHETTGKVWLNLGIRGAVSIQEYIALILHITKFKRVDNIFFLSGINDLYRNLSDSKVVNYDKRFSNQNELFSYSSRRIFYAFFKSLFVKKTVNEILTSNMDEELGVAYSSEKSRSIFESQYTRNFVLYSALSKQLGCSICFGFQPFFHVAKKKGTEREIKAILRTNSMQLDTEWSVVRERIIENIDFSSRLFANLCERHGFKYVDFNRCFDGDVDYFVDTVHLTDAGNRKIVEVYNELVN